ncbi:hypothetical protein HMPREF1250_0278 [Megasphaera vaginalis (ex Srinivasan et al. 2021)]|uniref:Uncharacterized protein n=2 Tax=Megasphaera vaginalis (ex Srinivasan et al. 2021) TaxID=1111454 RepID=U7UNE5_9FIRM|nr:hypothetical protein HMPREF1250_0278 [Megasphaera vaginalis (ex Srinivasan et al. 2021)]
MVPMGINWHKVHENKQAEQYHRPENIGAVITMVLLYQALHDTYGYGRATFAKIMSTFGDIQAGEWSMNSEDVDMKSQNKSLERCFIMSKNEETY